jgi:hypothetical protein
MRKILLLAACAATVIVHPKLAHGFTAQPSPNDPKYNSPECRSARSRTYDGLSPAATMAIGMVSGFAGTLLRESVRCLSGRSNWLA